MNKPRIAITMGDPAGIGPQTVVSAWNEPVVHEFCTPFVVGHPAILRRAIDWLKLPIRVTTICAPNEAQPSLIQIPCLPAGTNGAADVPPGEIDPRGGQAAHDALLMAAHLALDGQVDAITTGPLHKAALARAGHNYPGHTELLAELCGTRDYAMMLYLARGTSLKAPHGLAIVHVTLHMALADVFASLTSDAVFEKARLVSNIMDRISGSQPRVGVCALNPHCGEEGLFGDEESRIIRPAVERGIAEGLNLTGPLPADTLIARACQGEFDAIVAMYHDQGHIAVKLLAMHQAVNITLGLPIIRTSVAHGTAFDLAWRAPAEHSGLVEALRVASLLASKKNVR